jgi:glutamate synthase (ferredoxin)
VAGAEPQEALAVLVPEAFRNHPDLMKEYPEVCEGYERLALGLEC